MDEVYIFITLEDLATIKSMDAVVTRICQQTMECVYFLRDYAKVENFCKQATNSFPLCHVYPLFLTGLRTGKNFMMSEADANVKKYNAVFDDLMEQFRNRAARDTIIVTNRVLTIVEGIGGCLSSCTPDPFQHSRPSRLRFPE